MDVSYATIALDMSVISLGFVGLLKQRVMPKASLKV